MITNDPYHMGGGLNRPAAEKMETFVDLCDTFHLPVINFVDQPGTVVGIEGERMGNVRGSVRVVSAIEQSGALVRDRDPPALRAGRHRLRPNARYQPALRMAVRALGLDPVRGRHRGRLPPWSSMRLPEAERGAAPAPSWRLNTSNSTRRS